MLKIDRNKFDYKFNCANCEVTQLANGSIRIVRYTQLKEKDKTSELLTLEKVYYRTDYYNLKVNLPAAPALELIAFVSHTSQNSWQVVTASSGGWDISRHKTLAEVQTLLKDFFK